MTITSISIFGKRWFNGHSTYYSAYVLINGAHVEGLRIDYACGYGNCYLDEMFTVLEDKGILPVPREHYSNGASEAPWRYCERAGITFTHGVCDVKRKKDL